MVLWPLSTVGSKVVPVFELPADVCPLAPDEALRTLLASDVDVGGDLLDLLDRDLRTDHGGRVQRVALADLADPIQAALHEAGRRSTPE